MREGIGIVIILILAIWWRQERLKGLGLILAGGVMNIGERWLWGRVNDYWTVPIVNINNNLADWLIAVGVVVVLWELWQKTRLR